MGVLAVKIFKQNNLLTTDVFSLYPKTGETKTGSIYIQVNTVIKGQLC